MFNYCYNDSDYMKLNLHGISKLQYLKCELNFLSATIYKKRKKDTLYIHDIFCLFLAWSHTTQLLKYLYQQNWRIPKLLICGNEQIF